MITNQIQVTNVTRIMRPGVGPVYRAVVPIHELYILLRDSVIRYAPRYQRGYTKAKTQDENFNSGEFDKLLPLNDPSLGIDSKRAEMMAVKYLMGRDPTKGKRLFSADVIWNARLEADGKPPSFDPDMNGGTLTIYSVITIPDTAHRHMAYFLLGHWWYNPVSIPQQVIVDDTVVDHEEIVRLVDLLKFENAEENSVYAEIFNLSKENEGFLYDEFNSDAKPPSRATALDLNPAKTPSRRFTSRLMAKCPIFSEDEVETRFNTIGSKSRKLTTNSTIESAIRPFKKSLDQLENDGTNSYDDLIEFFGAFYTEWSHLYLPFAPGANADDRRKLREKSLASANIIFFPMFRIAYTTWEHYRAAKKDWRGETEWKDALSRLAGTDPGTVCPEAPSGYEVMDRLNPEWQGKILIQTYDQQGNPKPGGSLSSTRQTREAAYVYLARIADLDWLLAA